jgi:hypothetical protein
MTEVPKARAEPVNRCANRHTADAVAAPLAAASSAARPDAADPAVPGPPPARSDALETGITDSFGIILLLIRNGRVAVVRGHQNDAGAGPDIRGFRL